MFYINLPLALLSIIIIALFFKIKETLNHEKVDYRGAILMVLGLTAILIGIQLLGVASIFITIAFVIVGGLLIFWMSRVESQVDDPIVPNRLFKNEKLVIDLILFALLWGSFVAFNIYIPMWAQGIMGLSALIGGMTQIPGAIANFIGSELEPLIQRKLNRYSIIGIGTIAFLISFAGLYVAKQSASYTFLLIMGVFEGFGVGICFNALLIAVQFDVEERDVPISTSFAYLVRILSQTFMSSIYGVILNIALMHGVKNSNGHITMTMMNKLSNAADAKYLPKALIPEMRRIFFSGIHSIMLTAMLLIVAVILILGYLFRREHTKKLS